MRLWNFVRPCTRQTWLGTARNFAKTRFKQFRTFDFSTPEKFFWRALRTDKFVFCWFGVDLDELRRNGRRNQLLRQISLKIDLPWGLYDQKSWRRRSVRRKGPRQSLKTARSKRNDIPLRRDPQGSQTHIFLANFGCWNETSDLRSQI